jgi:predicted ester cyclase
MSLAENKQLIRRFIQECVFTHNTKVVDKFIHPDWHSHGTGSHGLDGFKAQLAVESFFEYIDINIEDLVAEDDRVALREIVRAKHIAEFMGVPSTGKTLSWQFMAFFRIAEGKIIEQWESVNLMEILQQLQQPDTESDK